MLFSCANELLNLVTESLYARKFGLKKIYPNIVNYSNWYLIRASCPSKKTVENHSNKEWSMSSQILMNLAPPSVHSENKHELYWILNVSKAFCLFYFSFHFQKSCTEVVLWYFVNIYFSALVVTFSRHLVPKDESFLKQIRPFRVFKL